MPASLQLSLTDARRLAVSAQRLEQRPSHAGPDELIQTIEALGCLQIDPLRALDYTQHLVLWSRLGAFDRAELARLLYDEKRCFEYWAHCASIVGTNDYPLHATWMRAYAREATRDMQWIDANPDLHRHILGRLASDGPMSSDQFDATLIQQPWHSSGWNHDRSVGMMLTFLWLKGEIMVARREGRKRFWQLRDAQLPDWTPRTPLSEAEAVRLAVQRSLAALGVATPKQITQYFTRNNYPGLLQTLAALEAEGLVQRASIWDGAMELAGDWYVHIDSLDRLEAIRRDPGRGRTTLLSPFDNLICDRERTEQLFDFRYRVEIYVPRAKREFGYYVVPILHGERLIGRVDAKLERKTMRLTVNNVYAEDDAPPAGAEVAAALEDLARFLEADAIDYLGERPRIWADALQ